MPGVGESGPEAGRTQQVQMQWLQGCMWILQRRMGVGKAVCVCTCPTNFHLSVQLDTVVKASLLLYAPIHSMVQTHIHTCELLGYVAQQQATSSTLQNNKCCCANNCFSFGSLNTFTVVVRVKMQHF